MCWPRAKTEYKQKKRRFAKSNSVGFKLLQTGGFVFLMSVFPVETDYVRILWQNKKHYKIYSALEPPKSTTCPCQKNAELPLMGGISETPSCPPSPNVFYTQITAHGRYIGKVYRYIAPGVVIWGGGVFRKVPR